MARAKGRLQAALAREKKVDFKAVVEKRKAKQRSKTATSGKANGSSKKSAEPDNEEEWEDDEEDESSQDDSEDDEDEEDEDEDAGGAGLDLSRLEDESDSDSEVEMEEKITLKSSAKKPQKKQEEKDDDDEEDDDEDGLEEIDSDVELDEEEAALAKQRTTINNTSALENALKRIAIATSPSTPFVNHLSIVSSKSTADSIPDISDDIQRELAFLAQAKEAAVKGRELLRKEGVPFTRPTDYFAEMLRDQGIMDKVKAKLVEEATAKKASAEARRQRDLKKFGKQVQVAKQQERAKQKRETLEKIQTLKRKRQDSGASALGANEVEDLFDVAVDNEIGGGQAGSKRSAGRSNGERGPPNAKRQKKDSKYGFGGKKRHAKSGDATSSGDLSGFSVKKMKGKTARPGKARRKASAAKR